jgi:serine/threonine-protein kinase
VSVVPVQPDIDRLLGVELGGFRVKRLLASGGMGLVYEAVHEAIGRRAAVKVLKPEVARDTEWTRRFLSEARTLGALKHRNLIEILNFGKTPDGREFLMMEFLDGESLQDLIHREAPLPPALALQLVDQVLNGLAEAHKKGVVHRDLKPSNVHVLREHNGERLVKVLDFGLSRQDPVSLLDGRPTPRTIAAGASLVAGTPEYIAPEQALGKAVDASADLYSLGVMLFEMLSGRLPFLNEGGLTALLLKHVNDPPPKLSALVDGLPPGLEALVEGLLEKNPAARPHSADEVRGRVQGLLKQLAREATGVGQRALSEKDVVPARNALDPTVPSIPALRTGRTRRAVQALALLALGALAVVVWRGLEGPEPASTKPDVGRAATGGDITGAATGVADGTPSPPANGVTDGTARPPDTAGAAIGVADGTPSPPANGVTDGRARPPETAGAANGVADSTPKAPDTAGAANGVADGTPSLPHTVGAAIDGTPKLPDTAGAATGSTTSTPTKPPEVAHAATGPSQGEAANSPGSTGESKAVGAQRPPPAAGNVAQSRGSGATLPPSAGSRRASRPGPVTAQPAPAAASAANDAVADARCDPEFKEFLLRKLSTLNNDPRVTADEAVAERWEAGAASMLSTIKRASTREQCAAAEAQLRRLRAEFGFPP